KWLYESFGFVSWAMQSLLLAAAIAAPLFSSMAIMSERGVPTFLDVIGQTESRVRSREAILLGGTLAVVTLIAAVTALSLVFDPRWRDLPYPAITMAAVPLWVVTLFNRSKPGAKANAEVAFAALLAVAALAILFNEGFHNWQSLWLCAGYGLLSATLWRVQPGTVRRAALAVSGVAQALLPSRLRVAVTNGAPDALHVIASQRVGAERRPMTGSTKQSSSRSETGLLRRLRSSQ
ncbi:MAG: hypothetical protein QOI46_1961, partial [Alphaproteobacteria bacterium]|nr:hypothetical protein [Alphaproteobacteria bacterium]